MTPALLHDIAAVSAALDEARAQAEAGAPIDLAGLESRVSELCAAAEDHRGGALAEPLRAEFQALVAALDALAGTLARQRETMAAAAEGRPDPHSARQRAASAYGRTAAPPSPAPTSDKKPS
ncbi:hypothetical protein [Azospirillum rugosum]|uniref:Uncharacterized protein n=1 Tax=Azospirillum rugosum TaxID=416170 RepID=A0ABS4SLX3_9PROT|nr:hypothetical protein [Azospirillum rugosum]MBP2293563.1 hypothetical protein [Azospirillum rugosum]MDQ0529242.1 hypothetical protein [Azospirillum rugosum]